MMRYRWIKIGHPNCWSWITGTWDFIRLFSLLLYIFIFLLIKISVPERKIKSSLPVLLPQLYKPSLDGRTSPLSCLFTKRSWQQNSLKSSVHMGGYNILDSHFLSLRIWKVPLFHPLVLNMAMDMKMNLADCFPFPSYFILLLPEEFFLHFLEFNNFTRVLLVDDDLGHFSLGHAVPFQCVESHILLSEIFPQSYL